MKAVLAERGQLTIPKALRIKLGLKPGTVLDVQLKNSYLVIVKSSKNDVIEQVYGCLANEYKSTDKLIKELRGE